MTEETTAQPGNDTTVAQTEAATETTETKTVATIAGGGDVEIAKTDTAKAAKDVVAGDWPTDWRQRLAGEDAKELKRLERFGSPLDIMRSYRALEQRVSSGELKKALPENASDEEKATWRKENGIPDKPDGYIEKLALPNGIVPGEADKPILNDFAKRAMEKNWSPNQYNEAVSWYYENLDAQRAAQEDADAQHKQTAEDDLRSEWGPDYRRHVNAVGNLLSTAPEGLADRLLAGRTADGKKIGDDPAIVRWLSQLSREINPAATLVPAGTSDAGKNISDRIADMEKMMGDRSSDYWRGPKAEAMQAEYRDLITARDKMKDRAA